MNQRSVRPASLMRGTIRARGPLPLAPLPTRTCSLSKLPSSQRTSARSRLRASFTRMPTSAISRAAALLFYVATASGAVTFIAWWALGDLNAAFVRTVTVLVIACPHALGLAIPLVISISTSVAARAGILVKDRLALERMRNIDAVLFDKTGTLTKGRPALSGIAATGIAEDELLALAASRGR